MHTATLASDNGEVANQSSPPMDLPFTSRRAQPRNRTQQLPDLRRWHKTGDPRRARGQAGCRRSENMCVHAFDDPAYFVKIFQTLVSSGLAKSAPPGQPPVEKDKNVVWASGRV